MSAERRVQDVGRPVDAIAINAGVGVGGPFVETALAQVTPETVKAEQHRRMAEPGSANRGRSDREANP
jgi:hypothetical protein